MVNKDIRWVERFDSFNKVFSLLLKAKEEYQKNQANEIIKEIVKVGVIKYFEMTYELAWNTMKDYYENQGETGIQGSKDTFKLAFNRGLITDSENWFAMIDSRQLSIYSYDEKTSNEVVNDIVEKYIDLFIQLQSKLQVEKLKS